VATPKAELTLLQQGDVDVIYDATSSQVAANQFNNGILSSESAQATTSFLWLNQSQPPFNAGPDVWNAVKRALDYNGMINQVLLGAGINVQTLSWKGLAGYDANDPFQQGPAQVKQLLTQAGFPGGISFTLTYNGDDSIIGVYAPKLQADFATCGMTVALESIPGGQVQTDFGSGKFQAPTTWEGGGLQHIANNAWRNLDPRAGFFPKWTGWTSTMAEKLVDATKTATGSNFLSACQTMTEWALTNSPSVSLFQRNKQLLMSSSVVGLVMLFARDNMDFGRVYKRKVSGFS
jgi:ABC-type transport system substrate-binding protein